MSAIDYEICDFFNRKVNIELTMRDYLNWMREFESVRADYPDWITKAGVHIKIYNLEDSHLNNLIAFVARKDKDNKTNWITALKQEKHYRELKAKVAKIKAELAEMEKIIDMCL